MQDTDIKITVNSLDLEISFVTINY